MIDVITQFGCNLSGSACYNSYRGDMGGGGSYGGGGGSYFLKRGVRKKGVLENPLNPPLATGLRHRNVSSFISPAQTKASYRPL